MQLLTLSSQKTRVVAGLTGIVIASLALAGCGKLSSNNPSSTTTDTTLTNPAGGQPATAQTPAEMTPGASPTMMKAATTGQAVTNEGAQLNALNKDAPAIDQSLNDQAGNVN